MTSSDASPESSGIRGSKPYVIATAFFALLAIVGFALYGLPFFYDFFVKEFGWSRTVVTSGNALGKLIIAPLFGFLAGWLIDRYGPRKLMLAGSLLAGSALIGLSMMNNLGMFYFFYILNALGYVFGGPLPCQVLISRWFEKNRGKAMGIAYLGIGTGGAGDGLSAGVGEQAVHRDLDPAAGAGRQARHRRSRAQMAALAAARGRQDHPAPPAHAHLGPHRLRGPDGRALRGADPRCRRTRPAGEGESVVFHAGQRVPLQQQRLCAAGAGRRARLGDALSAIPAGAHLHAAGNVGVAGPCRGRSGGAASRLRPQRGRGPLAAHRPEFDQRGAR